MGVILRSYYYFEEFCLIILYQFMFGLDYILLIEYDIIFKIIVWLRGRFKVQVILKKMIVFGMEIFEILLDIERFYLV